jgi:hypothetical protein
LPSATLGKEPRPGHRYRFFTECNVSDTRQIDTLCQVPYIALGKEPDMGTLPGGFFAECSRWHSAKKLPLPSVIRDTRQRRRLRHPVAVTTAFLCRVPKKKYSAKKALRCTVCRAFLAECDTRQRLCRVFLKLCRVLRALGKALVSGSAYLHLLLKTYGSSPPPVFVDVNTYVLFILTFI